MVERRAEPVRYGQAPASSFQWEKLQSGREDCTDQRVFRLCAAFVQRTRCFPSRSPVRHAGFAQKPRYIMLRKLVYVAETSICPRASRKTLSSLRGRCSKSENAQIIATDENRPRKAQPHGGFSPAGEAPSCRRTAAHRKPGLSSCGHSACSAAGSAFRSHGVCLSGLFVAFARSRCRQTPRGIMG